MASSSRHVPIHRLRVSVRWNDKVLGDTYKLLLKSQEWVENNDCIQSLKAAVAASPDGATLMPTMEDASNIENISLKEANGGKPRCIFSLAAVQDEDHPFRDTFVCDDALTCESRVEWEYYTHQKKSMAWSNPDMCVHCA
eukprot:jgi/Tetstr1/439612/TSEL_028036.t1